MTILEKRYTKAGVLGAACNIGRRNRKKTNVFNAGNAIIRINGQ